jgi:choline dehydrogenase-like flavoprotein
MLQRRWLVQVRRHNPARFCRSHFVGACAVGRVLDANLKVKGFANLRVVDSSAIPEMPLWAGPASSVYMLAEHGASLLVADAPAKLT